MGRDALKPTEIIEATPLPVAQLQEVQQLGSIALDVQQAHVRAIAAQVGYQLPGDMIDPDLIQRDIAANMRRSVEACLEVGRGLKVLKAACEHGQFIARLDVLGLERNVAARFMSAASKFSNAPTSAHLIKAIGTQSKLLEMLVLDDDQIEELELIGQTGELKLDDIATMSVKELRKSLREARETAADKDRVLETRNEKINELDEKLIRTERQMKAMQPVEMGEHIRVEATKVFSKIDLEIRAARPALEALQAHGAEHSVAHGEFMAGLVAQLQFALNQLRSEFDLKSTPDGEEIPDWIKADGDEALARFQRQQMGLPLDEALPHGTVLNPVEG